MKPELQRDMTSIVNYKNEVFKEESGLFRLIPLTGGLCGGVRLLEIRENGHRYILKKSGDSDNPDDRIRIEQMMAHLKGIESYFSNLAKSYLSFEHGRDIYVVYEYLEDAEERDPTIDEIIAISSDSFRASKDYDYRTIQNNIDFQKSVLFEIESNGIDRYSEEFFHPYVDEKSSGVIPWMKRWAHYFIEDEEFKDLYRQCLGFIHRDIHRDNIMISGNEPYLIDYDFCNIDCRLFDLTRPMVIYVNPEDFLNSYLKMKKKNKMLFSSIESQIIDRIAVLDILACSGWEAVEIKSVDDKRVKNEFRRLLTDRIQYLKIMMENPGSFNLSSYV